MISELLLILSNRNYRTAVLLFLCLGDYLVNVSFVRHKLVAESPICQNNPPKLERQIRPRVTALFGERECWPCRKTCCVTGYQVYSIVVSPNAEIQILVAGSNGW